MARTTASPKMTTAVATCSGNRGSPQIAAKGGLRHARIDLWSSLKFDSDPGRRTESLGELRADRLPGRVELASSSTSYVKRVRCVSACPIGYAAHRGQQWELMVAGLATVASRLSRSKQPYVAGRSVACKSGPSLVSGGRRCGDSLGGESDRRPVSLAAACRLPPATRSSAPSGPRPIAPRPPVMGHSRRLATGGGFASGWGQSCSSARAAPNAGSSAGGASGTG